MTETTETPREILSDVPLLTRIQKAGFYKEFMQFGEQLLAFRNGELQEPEAEADDLDGDERGRPNG